MNEALPPPFDDMAGCAGSPRALFKRAEETLAERRSHPPDMSGAVSEALKTILYGEEPPPDIVAAGQAIAEAVTAYAHSRANANEPAYHNQYHQAEATVAMGWLCAMARRLGLLDATTAMAGVLAMAGHDLRHDGSNPAAGILEAHSATLTVELAARAGLDETTLATIRRVIMATDPLRSSEEQASDDLICRLGQEADLFASLTPVLGWRLGQFLARETHAVAYDPEPRLDSFAGRLQLLRSRQPASPAGRQLGLDAAVADQIAALAIFGDGDPQQGAARLDARPFTEARADYLAALAAIGSQ